MPVACLVRSGPTLCAILVLRATFERYSGVEADFVAMVDAPAKVELAASLKANSVVVAEMDFENFGVFSDYLLMRKFYVLKLEVYSKVLLLDSDTIVVGSLRHLFSNEAVCGRAMSEECWAESDGACAPDGKPAVIVAQQTAGTPVLTAFMMVSPSRDKWLAAARALEALCGGTTVCNRRHIYARGWNATLRPRDWALRLGRSRSSRTTRDGSWRAMGAGFTDQGFAEYWFAQHLGVLYSISHRTCKLHYVHYNMPPKPWFCPGRHCTRKDAPPIALREGDLRWGGHKCASDWWWQFALAAPEIRRVACAARCLDQLGQAVEARRDAGLELSPANYTPVCKDWNPRWPLLRYETRPSL